MADTKSSIEEAALESQSSPTTSTKICEVCDGIWSCLLDPTASRQVSLGYADYGFPPHCPGHSPLLIHYLDNHSFPWSRRSYADDLSDEEDTSITGHTEDGGVTEVDWHTSSQLVVDTDRYHKIVNLTRLITSRISTSQRLVLMKKDSIPDHPGTGLTLDSKWVDLRLAKEWKQRCLEQHGMKCHNPLKVPAVRPQWVVDIQRECIVPGRDCDAFVALSYRWGNHSWPKVNREMLSTIRDPGALFKASFAPIIRHAMSLTSKLGERYLWVDALCIVQGDSTETADQLNLMGAFYANAIITIVVADGDSVVGIKGLKDVSGARKAKQTLVPFGEETIIFPETEINLGSYGTRGWTYQEYIMSQRRLIFAGDRMHWECQSCDWHEEVVCSSETNLTPLYRQSQADLILRGLPDIDSLSHIMSEYNSRSFSYEEDVLPGISGLLSIFSRSFQGGFLCGLPEMFFDRSLGWREFGDMQRRKPSGRPEKNKLAHALGLLPSWSWIGWKGTICDDSLEPMEAIRNRNSFKNYPIEETIPITNWYTSISAKGPARRKINSTWFENRNVFYKDYTRPLPEGWICHEDHNAKYSGAPWYPPGCSNYLFQHRLFPHKIWYYPFPITQIQESTPPSMPEQTPYLFCKTQKARLWAVCSIDLWEAVEKRSLFHGTNLQHQKQLRALEIRTGCNGPAVGVLHLNSTDQLTPFLIASGEHIKMGPGQPVELVAINRARVHDKSYFSSGPPVTSEIYRVLWVEWENGIAYRLGVGWVEKEVWEKINRTDVDLVLG